MRIDESNVSQNFGQSKAVSDKYNFLDNFHIHISKI